MNYWEFIYRLGALLQHMKYVSRSRQRRVCSCRPRRCRGAAAGAQQAVGHTLHSRKQNDISCCLALRLCNTPSTHSHANYP